MVLFRGDFRCKSWWIVVDTGYAGIHHLKYGMPIHYDTIGDGQNKKSHLLFSNLYLKNSDICDYVKFGAI